MKTLRFFIYESTVAGFPKLVKKLRTLFERSQEALSVKSFLTNLGNPASVCFSLAHRGEKANVKGIANLARLLSISAIGVQH